MGTTAVRYTDTELLDGVRAVALVAAADAPEKLSQPQFDRHRDDVADEYPQLPTARAIYMRINSGNQGRVSWGSLVRAAVKGGAAIRQTVVAARRSTPGVPLTERGVFFALRLVAGERETNSPSPDEYDATADTLRRSRRGALAKLLPTANQLTQFAGGWDDALQLAQLEPRNRTDGESATQRKSKRKPAAVSVPDAILLFVAHQGALPTRPDLRWFAKTAGFALANDGGQPWDAAVTEARRKWAAEGRWFPPRAARQAERARYQPKPGDLPAGLPPRTQLVDLDTCVDAVVAYWDTLPPGREPKQKPYGTWATASGYPAHSRFTQFGGFSEVRELARKKRRAAAGDTRS